MDGSRRLLVVLRPATCTESPFLFCGSRNKLLFVYVVTRRSSVEKHTNRRIPSPYDGVDLCTFPTMIDILKDNVENDPLACFTSYFISYGRGAALHADMQKSCSPHLRVVVQLFSHLTTVPELPRVKAALKGHRILCKQTKCRVWF